MSPLASNRLLRGVQPRFARAVKGVANHTPLGRLVFYRYDYMFHPMDLSFLVQCVTDTAHLRGPILELGCAGGHTSVFLNKHLDDLEGNRSYFAIDTFAGFTPEDVEVEIGRGKQVEDFDETFRAYRREWYERTMQLNGVTRVTAIEADVNIFDFSRFSDISFCLIDVDLYRPVMKALDEVIPRMAPGGIIVIDDCMDLNKYDGAYQAYMEITERLGAPQEIHRKLGVLRF
jgi:SAM-dependent methyltransferase